MEGKLKKLEERIKLLEERRVHQTMVMPDAIRQRHIGEGVRFIRSGLAADRPTSGEEPLQGSAAYFATDTGVLSIWDGDAWLTTTLS